MLCLIGVNHCTNPPTYGIANVIQAKPFLWLGNHHHHGVGDKEKGYKG